MNIKPNILDDRIKQFPLCDFILTSENKRKQIIGCEFGNSGSVVFVG